MKRSMRFIMLMLFAATVTTAAPKLNFGKATTEWEAKSDFSKAVVYVATNATVPEIEAAKLIMRTIRLLNGKPDSTNLVPEVAAQLPESGIIIGWQGSALVKPYAEALGLKAWRDSNGRDTIAQFTSGALLFLAGNSPEGAYYAVADLLYHNGARFIHSGTLDDLWDGGTFLEFVQSIQAPQARVYTPVAQIRTGFALGDYRVPKGEPALSKEAAIQYNIARSQYAIRNGASPQGPLCGGHSRGFTGSECIQPAYNDFHKTPDFFPMVNGQRWRPAPGGWCWVVEGCWSNPGFTQWVIDRICKEVAKAGTNMIYGLDVTNSDGGRRCDCPDCVKLRASYPDISSCYFDYQKTILKGVKQHYPWLKVQTLAYIMSREYPKAGNRVLAEIDSIDYCPYSRCYVHSYYDKSCPTNQKDLERMGEWKKSGLPIGVFDYSFDVFQPPMSIPSWELTAEVVKYWKEFNGDLGVPRMYIESATSEGGNGGKSRIAAYAVIRALWDDTCSADEHLQDYCRVGYGPAASIMLDYHRACAVAWTNQPTHITSVFNNPLGTAKTYFTDALQTVGRQAFVAAEALIRQAIPAEGPHSDKLAIKRQLAQKQLATLLFEKQCFEEWVALREQAMKTSMQLNLEIGEADAHAFERMPKIAFKTREAWQGEDITQSYAQLYRTADAIRVRVTSYGPIFKKKVWQESRADSNKAYDTDSMEFFVQFVGQNDYYQLAVSAEGECYDGCALDASFNSNLWRVENYQEDGLWQLTLTIPYKLFGDIQPKEGDIFKFIAINNSQKLNERGEPVRFAVGIPFPAYHDMAIGIDLRLDNSIGRRVGDE